MNVSEAIRSVYPKAEDCINGHIGQTVKDIVAIAEEDRIEYETIYRCDHCGMVKTNKIEVRELKREYKAVWINLLDLVRTYDWKQL